MTTEIGKAPSRSRNRFGTQNICALAVNNIGAMGTVFRPILRHERPFRHMIFGRF